MELTADGAASVGFILKADTRLTGRMLDASGSPIKGVCVDLEPVEGRGENGARFFDCSKEGGVFVMKTMPPGQYRLVASDEVKMGDYKSKSTLYYPGRRDRENATIVSVEAGKYVDRLDIRLPADEKRYRITGRMQFEDGAPVANTLVTFTSKKSGYSETTSTGADGSFGFLVVAEMEGELRGQMGVFARVLEACPQFKTGRSANGMFRVMDANPIPLKSDSDRENLKLILPFASCKDWPPLK